MKTDEFLLFVVLLQI